MRIALRQLACMVWVVAAAYGQATLTGTVHDASGRVPMEGSVEIRQIVPLKNRNVVPTGDADKTPGRSRDDN
jgi:hypothetical protein